MCPAAAIDMLLDVLTRCVRRYLAPWPAHGAALLQLDWTFTTGVDVHRYELTGSGELSDHRVQQLLVPVRAS
jgi:hypothetical protein